MNNQKLFLIIGPSGVGKSTIISELLKNSSLGLKFIPSFTTREMRNPFLISNPTNSFEKNGHSYFFIKREDFKLKIQNNNFIEWNIVHGNYYGLEKNMLFSSLEESSLIKDIEILGAMEIQKKLPNHCITIFINVDPSILLNRIKKREMLLQLKEKTILNRLNRQKLEVLYAPYFDFILNNSNFEHTLEEISNIIKNVKNGDFQKKSKTLIYIFIENPIFIEKVLIIAKKAKKSKFFVPNEYIHSNENFFDVIYRRIFLIFYPFSLKWKILISKIQNFNSNILKCEFSILNFQMENLEKLKTENFYIKWIDKSKIKF